MIVNDGIEDRIGVAGSQQCANTVSVGSLPWVTLGVGQFDVWQRNFAYGVTPAFADDQTVGPSPPAPATCFSPLSRLPPPPPGVSFELCSAGTFNICAVSPPAATCLAGTSVAQVPTVVISYGKNGGLPATTPDELENQGGDAVAVDKAYSSNPAQPFDDLVEFISANELMYIMLAGGVFR
ncbi:MAG: hypothetical protein ACREYE_11800 [Gammaproteobacteria bacterium]